jgi:hypothetical protein
MKWILPIILCLAGQAIAKLCIWRTTVTQGQTDYVWDTGANLPFAVRQHENNWSLTGPAGAVPNWPASDPSKVSLNGYSGVGAMEQWGNRCEDVSDGEAVPIPSTVAPGTYTFALGTERLPNPKTLTLTVRAAPVVQMVDVSPPGPDSSGQVQDASATIQAAVNTALASGNTMLQVNLAAGVYQINNTITLPAHVSVVGAHRDATILVRMHNPANASDVVFDSGSNDNSYATFSDFTLDSSHDPLASGCVLYRNSNASPAQNLSFLRLRLRRATGPQGPTVGMLCKDVKMVESGMSAATGHAALYNVEWDGLPVAGNNEITLGGDQNLVISCTWDQTCRGIVLRNSPTNSYFNSLVFFRIGLTNNASQIILADDASTATGMQNDLFTYIQCQGCVGPFAQISSPASNNVFRQFDKDCGAGIWLTGSATQTNNTFTDFELRHTAGGFLLNSAGSGATYTTIENGAIVAPLPSHCNSWGYDPSRLLGQALFNDIGGPHKNWVRKLVVVSLPSGWTIGSSMGVTSY